jgi:lysozyme family protein
MFGMFIQSHSGGSGYGFGYETAAMGSLMPLEDFKCNASICYAIGKENHTLFLQLQQTINTLSGAGGFKPLVVDGFIGASTVAALQTLTKIGLQGSFATKEDVAKNAVMLTQQVQSLAATRQSAGQKLSPPGAPTPAAAAAAAPSSSITPAQAATMPPMATSLPKSHKTLWLIAGGLAAVLAVGVGGYVVYRRKARG